MKLITLFVGNRLDHVIDFDSNESVRETYIVEHENGKTDLFAFYLSRNDGNEIIFQNNDGESTLHIKKISATSPNTDEINIKIVLSIDDTQMELSGLDIVGLKYSPQKSLGLVTLERKCQRPIKVMITFCLLMGGDRYHKALSLCVAKRKDISDVVLDFGSEASQMGVFKRNETQTLNGIRELFTEMKELLPVVAKTSSSALADRFVQEDNDGNFFRSVFFAKKSFSDADAGTPISILSGKKIAKNKVMEMLTTHQEAQNLVKNQGYIQIPNVKITQFGGVNLKLPRVGPQSESILRYNDGYFYRASINNFILNALLKANTPCISLYVLMPNVYSPLQVIKSLQWIRKDIGDMLMSNPQLNERVKAVELSAISESDASLLGVISAIEGNNNTSENVKPGKYIIIDAGKGTLDYSAIQYEKNEMSKIYCIYRSGFIGAGNALTYAYLFALLRDYMDQAVIDPTSENNLLSFIYENILGCTPRGKGKGGGELNKLLELMQAVENYKIAMGSGDREEDNEINPLEGKKKYKEWEDVEMPSVIDFIKKMVPSEENKYKPLSDNAKQYVTQTICQIVDQVCNNLSILTPMGYGKADGVIFAGRGFALQEFKQTMKERLEERGIVDVNKELTYQNAYIGSNTFLKSFCLYIRTAITEGIYNSHMITVPVVLRDKSLLFPNRESHKELWDRLQEIFSGLCSLISAQGGSLVNTREKTNQSPGSIRDNGMVHGFHLNVHNGDSLMIGGTKYPMRFTGNITVFFSSDTIYYRYTDAHQRMRVEDLVDDYVDLRNSPFLFGTLFPNVAVDDIDDIYLPYNPDAEKNENEVKKGGENTQQETAIEAPIETNISSPKNIRDSATNRAHELAGKV